MEHCCRLITTLHHSCRTTLVQVIGCGGLQTKLRDMQRLVCVSLRRTWVRANDCNNYFFKLCDKLWLHHCSMHLVGVGGALLEFSASRR